jgi:hypothetical protein
MDLIVRLEGLNEPSGQIDLRRLEHFANRFRAALLRSAQAALGIPAYRRTLGDEEPPSFRLAGLTDGSTGLLLRSADDRNLTIESATRHLEGVNSYVATGQWPPYIYPGERQAWGYFYATLFDRRREGVAVVTVDGVEKARIDRGVMDALEQAPILPNYQLVTVIGELRLIEWEGQPHFNVRTPEVDLNFPMTDEIRESVDANRWRRVRALARWEVGTNRAQLVGDMESTQDPAGISVVGEVAVPGWVSNQIERIQRFARLPAGWSGPASKPVPGPRMETAKDLTQQIYEVFGDRIPPQSAPYFVPTAAGTVEFEWRVGNRELICELVSGGYDLLAVEAGEDIHEGTVVQRELFSWISWLLGGPRPGVNGGR